MILEPDTRGLMEYRLTPEAFAYMEKQKLSQQVLSSLQGFKDASFKDSQSWDDFLNQRGICSRRHIRLATEGALIGGLLHNGLNPELVILSDDAGQFDVFHHALCWVHAERTIHKLVGFNSAQKQAIEDIRSQIWDFYRDLKSYKDKPSVELQKQMETRFDSLFQTRTCFETLNLALKRLYKNKTELLLVLNRPEVPLHNNRGESDIREYAN